jgi:hypothetical protein
MSSAKKESRIGAVGGDVLNSSAAMLMLMSISLGGSRLVETDNSLIFSPTTHGYAEKFLPTGPSFETIEELIVQDSLPTIIKMNAPLNTYNSKNDEPSSNSETEATTNQPEFSGEVQFKKGGNIIGEMTYALAVGNLSKTGLWDKLKAEAIKSLKEDEKIKGQEREITPVRIKAYIDKHLSAISGMIAEGYGLKTEKYKLKDGKEGLRVIVHPGDKLSLQTIFEATDGYLKMLNEESDAAISTNQDPESFERINGYSEIVTQVA